MISMTDITTKSTELQDDITLVKKEIKRIASIKCRLGKAPGRKNYNEEMTAILQEEQLLKGVRDYLTGPRKNINTITEAEVAQMGYDEVCKAIRAIQSKKTHTKWAEDCLKDENSNYIPGSGESYKEACRIEAMLIERRAQVKPLNEGSVRKTELLALLDTMELATDLDVGICIERLREFITEA